MVVCDGGYAGWKFTRRDEWLVDACDLLLALWDGDPKTGTGHTVRYADVKGRPVRNVWVGWRLYRES